MFTRRGLLRSLPVFAASTHSMLAYPFRRRAAAPPAPLTLYIGCDTLKGSGKGIYRASFNPATGQLGEPALVAETVQPSYFAFGPASNGRRFLYAGNETDNASSSVTTFAMDLHTGAVHEVGKVSSGFPGPCFVSVDATGRSVYVADYAGGGVASYRIQPDGTLSQPVERVNFRDTEHFGKQGPNEQRQDGPHPHCAVLSPDNRFLVVNDLGNDQTSIFSVDAVTGQLALGQTRYFNNGRPGSGPRHVVFHPNQRWLYSINELDSTIDHYLWTTNDHAGESSQALLVDARTPVKTVSPDFPKTATNTAAEIAMAPGGYFVYASNRGEDSLVVFAVDQGSGALKLTQRIACGGKTTASVHARPDREMAGVRQPGLGKRDGLPAGRDKWPTQRSGTDTRD